ALAAAEDHRLLLRLARRLVLGDREHQEALGVGRVLEERVDAVQLLRGEDLPGLEQAAPSAVDHHHLVHRVPMEEVAPVGPRLAAQDGAAGHHGPLAEVREERQELGVPALHPVVDIGLQDLLVAARRRDSPRWSLDCGLGFYGHHPLLSHATGYRWPYSR